MMGSRFESSGPEYFEESIRSGGERYDDDGLEGLCPNCGAHADEECEVDCDCHECEGLAALDELDVQQILNAEDLDVAEAARLARIAAGVEDACRVCGCSETRACPGGCIWAEADLCSRCARALDAMARAWSVA
jgi:hypothetical protein